MLLNRLKTVLKNASFFSTDELEINPDAKEAVLFAILANETMVGNKTNFGDREGVPSVCMGKVCLPE
ncbi:anhydro-N-acetylmuramic acid kinase [compost metagenome]